MHGTLSSWCGGYIASRVGAAIYFGGDEILLRTYFFLSSALASVFFASTMLSYLLRSEVELYYRYMTHNFSHK